MLTIDDCIALSDLAEEEIEAISKHQRIPEIVAAEYGCYLMRTPDGVPGNVLHMLASRAVLHHFVMMHTKPEAVLWRAERKRGSTCR